MAEKKFVNKVKKNEEEYDIQDARIPEAEIADADKVLKVDAEGHFELGEVEGKEGPQGPVGPQGETGPQGPAGVGVPTGGTAGQVLTKVDGTDYNIGWANAGGGSTGKTVTVYANRYPDISITFYKADGTTENYNSAVSDTTVTFSDIVAFEVTLAAYSIETGSGFIFGCSNGNAVINSQGSAMDTNKPYIPLTDCSVSFASN